MAKETAEQRIQQYVEDYGVSVINRVMKRHDLAEEKRLLFTIRFGLTKEEKHDEASRITEQMNEWSKKIDEIDWELLSVYNINDKLRTGITRDIKKVYADDWRSGFIED